LAVFRAALHALERRRGAPGEGLKSPLIKAVIAACEARQDPALAKILSLLWRFAAEAARAEARGFAQQAAADARAPSLPRSLNFSPAANDERGAPPLLAVALDAAGADTPELDAAPGWLVGGEAPHVELPIDLIARSQPAPNRKSADTPRQFVDVELTAVIVETPSLSGGRGEDDAARIESAVAAAARLERAA
jgi:hypothetical protein